MKKIRYRILVAVLRLLRINKKENTCEEAYPRDIHVARYNHLNDEITRYRDLVWKIVAFSWAIYGATIWFFYLVGIKVLNDSSRFSIIFFFLIISTAALTTLCHYRCERMVEENQERRRNLENFLGLSDKRWAHDKNRERCTRINFLGSFIIFFALTWMPPLIMISVKCRHQVLGIIRAFVK